ncbi:MULTISPECIES: WXG100 family type VII secretion target [Streptomyces]|uniref:WXG100 family type VII secretion target n=1 Tax=Streptomyces TaxID=1883 RepID=UPI0004CA166C|nr:MULTISPECIES: WXG100 family type VII secretion target [Streptomyces]MDX2920052.1 WXG100 family type VII secretion target [Streptomyces sp. NE06-03C]MDX3608697.1 WXG100 family type VII secretion target [Streptomyces sp. FL06-04B]MDX3737043.1 WXG100 family type VII secretion target [Streptomyces sp. ID01-15D]
MTPPLDFTDGQIYVDYSHMENAADDMVQQTKAIDSILTNLEAELQELQRSWEGEDKAVYAEKQASWNNAVEEMKRILAEHSALLNDVSGSYKYSENSLKSLWEGVRIGS